MRPKRLICVIDPNPDSLGITMFSLSIRGFRTVGAHTMSQALKIAQEQTLDAVLSTIPILEAWDLPVPVVLKGDDPIASLVEYLKLACVKKRGPRKGFVPWNRRPVKPENNVCTSAKQVAS